MATFVHNEPTSLTVLQEQKLPEAFYDAIEEDIEPHGDIYFAIPNAMGALCLNQVGLDQLAARPSVIPKIVDVLTSERHDKALQEKENATQLGAYIDELVRHHPSLRKPLLNAVIAVLHRLKQMGSEERSDDETVYHILPAIDASASASASAENASSTATEPMTTSATVAESSSAAMDVSSSSTSTSGDARPAPSHASSSATGQTVARTQDSEQPDGYVDNPVVLHIGRTARVSSSFRLSGL